MFVGSSDSNEMFGEGGNDSLSGLGGDDTLHSGNGGNDTLNGGDGKDTAVGDPFAVNLMSLDGVDNDSSGTNIDTIGSDIENLTGGGEIDVLVGRRGGRTGSMVAMATTTSTAAPATTRSSAAATTTASPPDRAPTRLSVTKLPSAGRA